VVKLKCPRCGYVWDYKGKKQYYAKGMIVHFCKEG